MKRLPAAAWALLAGIIFSLLHQPTPEALAGQKHFLWRVKSSKATVYLLGSIHLMKRESYPLPQVIEDAFAGADTLVVEANVQDAGQMDAMQFLEGTFYTGGDTIRQHVSAETYALLSKEAAALGLPMAAVDPQRPWVIGMTLTSLELMKAGYSPSHGIDMHFLAKAGPRKITELEGLAFQLRLFSRFSDGEQEAFLLHTLRELRTLQSEADSIVRAWTQGDAASMQRIMSKGLTDPHMISLYEKLLYERNSGMAAKIEGFLRSGGTCFVVVGAGHLVGSRGIIQLLRQRGYAIEQM